MPPPSTVNLADLLLTTEDAAPGATTAPDTFTPEAVQREAIAILGQEDGLALLTAVLDTVADAGVDPHNPLADFDAAEDAVLTVLEAADDELIMAVVDLGDITWEEAQSLGEVLGDEDDLGAGLYWAAQALLDEEE
jgi:hypothetical protein